MISNRTSFSLPQQQYTYATPTVYTMDTAPPPGNDPGGSEKRRRNDATVDLTTFQDLLNKLEGSKKRQQRQQSVEGRRDIYAQGLASMMRNF